jgi:Uma2 family endonuclease
MVALSAEPIRPMSPQEFLAWEETQELRHEYVNGKVIAMTGGTIPHNDLALNLFLVLAPHVRSRGCRINVSDVKVKMRRRFRYPDLLVTCDDRDKNAIKLFQYPKVIVEVLSPSTESTDRREKLQEYQNIPTVQEYVLISSDRVMIEVYRRGEGRIWFYERYELDDTFILESLDFSCAIAQIYQDVALPETIEPEDLDDEENDEEELD